MDILLALPLLHLMLFRCCVMYHLTEGHIYLSHHHGPLQLILKPLSHSHPLYKDVYPTGEGREQEQRHQVQWECNKAGETEKGLPAHRVAGLGETLIVQTHVT